MAIKGLFHRVGGYGLKRVGLGEQKVEITHDRDGREQIRIRRSPVQLVHASLREGWGRAIVRPRKWDRAGYEGRHADGGRQAFRDMMERHNLEEGDLAAIAAGWRRQALLYYLGSVGMILVAFLIVRADASLLSLALSLGALCMSAMLVALALAAGFSRWRVIERRMGGLAEYLDAVTRFRWTPAATRTGDQGAPAGPD